MSSIILHDRESNLNFPPLDYLRYSKMPYKILQLSRHHPATYCFQIIEDS